ncbi:WD40 repeat domain-containing serine/threonine protein kinase [Nonomuraea africana]|uniref:WD40 repeat domain-containing serine/threonine protein kinase n=1 Tax=Nonomuraea africana TaxID=46171 RepID=UPI0033C54DFE
MGELRPLHPGEPPEVGHYRLVGGLGDGGQGSVYLGEGPGGRRIAVKILHARLLNDQHATRRFMQEGETAKRVAAFCTARVFETGLVAGRPYIVSEYVEGPSLHELVAERGPRTGGSLERLAVGTAAALAAIHRAGIVHRDFKPSNVLVGPDGPRVIDFGIAKAVDAGTTASSVVGTPGYMSPEQISGHSASPASDLFAWATTMAYAATGRALFAGESIPAVMHRILTEEPDLSGIGEPLRGVLAACLSKEPSARPTADRVLLSLLHAAAVDDPFHASAAAALEGRPEPAAERESAPAVTGDRRGSHRSAATRGRRDPGPLSTTDAGRGADRLPAGRRARGRGRPAVRRGRPIALAGMAVLVAGGVTIGLVWRADQAPPREAAKIVTSAPPTARLGQQVGQGFGEGVVTDLAIGDLEGTSVVAAAQAGTGRVSVWNPATGRMLARAPKDTPGVNGLAFATMSGRQALVWAAEDGNVRWWHPVGSAPVGTVRVCRNSPRVALLTRDGGPVVVAGCPDGKVTAWDLRTGRAVGAWLVTGSAVTSVSSAGDGTSAFVSNKAGRVFRMGPWDAKPVVKNLKGAIEVTAADRRVLAVQVRTGGVDVVDFEDGKPTCTVSEELADVKVAGEVLVGAGLGLGLWRLDTCERLAAPLASGKVAALAVGEVDGGKVVVAGVDGKGMRMWSLDGVPAGRGR